MKLKLGRRLFKASKRLNAAQGDGMPESLSKLGREMGFLDHLEELRWSLIKGFIALLVTTIIASFYADWIVQEVLMGPVEGDFFMYRLLGIDAETLVLQSRNPTGQFFAFIGVIIAVGIVMGVPMFVYFLWRFIKPGLYPHERASLRFAAVGAVFFFMLGIAFGYCIITPFALHFFSTFVISDLIVNEFDISRYFSMVTWWSFGTGLLFELPVVVYFLAQLGIATPERLRKSRKYALLVVLILGALFTPPDPISQILVATPLMLLYEGSIFVAVWSERKRQRMLKKAWGDNPDMPTEPPLPG
ncbi:MAG TPA: twin-arginine translocase subunit TatC [Rhodothermales bacterium]|nr:twin-arginine translocase subunit TatC [Rhodothermales bacterium]